VRAIDVTNASFLIDDTHVTVDVDEPRIDVLDEDVD
jgi:hypothetical protein